ncbi:acetyl-CoA acetyltransferase [Acidimicrobium ferrooxidans DSM 10331]|uniref:Probable acetyl-CoA acetyltransferase n=1 Tax=Acidimicrobium ferrooxidans (strain DSM 10331 / JCM 15462 / NBRC 103882 / ICP) TaxID=525909 RepID=C7LZY8_ACIFD|nr:acetyl-CoA C-acyltransferase [Acidimicrobium ferrooxidans]ACU54296.1 acetyl-CoA acetyltransferase [Acidimicrobium ferrooxidans DSM 10331]
MSAWLVGGVRTPFGRYGGQLASVRPDDLLATVLAGAVERVGIPVEAIDEVVAGCANQAGEDNRNVARMSTLLAGFGEGVPAVTVNRLCASGLEAIVDAARRIAVGEADVVVAGGVESMSRAPFVMPKAEAAFARSATVYDTTIGWRFVNPRLAERFGVDSMGETAENVAEEFKVTREDQDRFALRSHTRALAAQRSGRFAAEIVPVRVVRGRSEEVVELDEHPRETSLEALARLRPAFRVGGTVTAGNASGVNDGASAVVVASDAALARYGLEPWCEIVGGQTAGVPPRIMGIGPVPASRRLLERFGLGVADLDVVELNEAFAAQSLACLGELGLPTDPDDDLVNPNGGAIALGHPLGASGARLALTAAHELRARDGRYALVTMCVGVGQGVAALLRRP